MKIALYYPWLYLKSGAERVIAELVARSRHDWTIFTGRYESEATYPELKSARVVQLDDLTVRRTVAATAANCLKVLTRKLPLEGYDGLTVVCEGLGDLVVFRNRVRPTINVCLTPLRIAFDEVYQARYMSERSPATRVAVRAGAALFRAFDRRAWRRYDQVFCISDEVKRRALRGRLPGAAQAEVLHVGLGVTPERRGEETFERFFLLPGRVMWTKNIELGIEAFRRFRSLDPAFADYRLVVAGFVDRKSEPYLENLRRLAADAPVEFVEHPSDEDLRTLYRRCRATLFTALNEDWGIVPLEGMAHGKPTVAVDRGGPRESVRRGVDGFLEAPEPAAFAARMAELARDEELVRSMGSAGREAVKRFTWTGFVDRIDDELERLSAQAAADEVRADVPAAAFRAAAGRPRQ